MTASELKFIASLLKTIEEKNKQIKQMELDKQRDNWVKVFNKNQKPIRKRKL